MKRSHLILLVSLFASFPVISQERARYFDNFDTKRGVQVIKPAYVPVVEINNTKATRANTRLSNTKRYVKPTAISAPVKSSPRAVQMNVSEGLATSSMTKAGKFTMGANAGMKGFTTGNLVFDSYIVESSRRYGIDPLLIYAQMHQESSFKLKALSNKGASGLMQLMPATARRLGVTNIYDPKQNIDGGVKYMRMLLDMFNGDVVLALAGYNAGEGAVMKYGYNVPPYNETREYVRRISARYASISDGTFAHNYRRVNNKEAIKLEEKEAKPLTVLAPNALAIRLPDGRMRLVNQ